MQKKFLQFELWKDCSNGCIFCQNRGIKDTRKRTDLLNHAIQVLQTDKEEYDSISLIGGEFFGGELNSPDVKSLFFTLTAEIAKRVKAGSTSRNMICTALMFSDISDWQQYLALLKDLDIIGNTLVCTSWDYKYRFNDTTKRAWENNVRELHEKYPEARLHVEMVLTQFFIDAYMSNNISIKDFEEQWNCKVDFNAPFKPFQFFEDKQDMQKAIPDFFPRRHDFLQFLIRAQENGDIDLRHLINIENHCDRLFYTVDGKTNLELDSRHLCEKNTCVRPGPCRHKCCGYIDHDKKIHKDIKDFLALID